MKDEQKQKSQLVAELKALRQQVARQESLIAEREQVEEALSDSQEQFRALSEAAFEAVFLSEKGICVGQNMAAENMFGYTLSEAIGRSGTDWIAPKDREMVKHNMLSGYKEAYQATALRRDGSAFSIELRGKMMRYQGREVRVTAARDITERVQAEQALAEKTMYLDNILRSATEYAIVTTDLDFRITYYNPLAERFSGYTAEEVIGKTVQEMHTQ